LLLAYKIKTDITKYSMEKIIKLIEQLKEDELTDIKDLIEQKITDIKYETDHKYYKKHFIPKIFHNFIEPTEFDCDRKENDCFDDYKKIQCYGSITFTKNISLNSSYVIYAKNDWNEGDIKIDIQNACKNKKTGKKFSKEYAVKYKCFKDKSTISSSALIILDKLGLEQNIFNKKMLGVLINNFVSNTKITCDDERDSYHERNIYCRELDEDNSDETMNKADFLKIDEKYKISFEYK